MSELYRKFANIFQNNHNESQTFYSSGRQIGRVDNLQEDSAGDILNVSVLAEETLARHKRTGELQTLTFATRIVTHVQLYFAHETVDAQIVVPHLNLQVPLLALSGSFIDVR